MANLPNFDLGRNVGTLTVAGVTVSATGSLSPGTARSALAQFKTFRLTQTNDLEDVSSTSARRKNNMITASGTDIEITGFLFANDSVGGTVVNYLRNICQSFDYVQAVASYGGVTWTEYCVIQEYQDNITGKGGIEFTLSLSMVDPGGTNPTLT